MLWAHHVAFELGESFVGRPPMVRWFQCPDEKVSWRTPGGGSIGNLVQRMSLVVEERGGGTFDRATSSKDWWELEAVTSPPATTTKDVWPAHEAGGRVASIFVADATLVLRLFSIDNDEGEYLRTPVPWRSPYNSPSCPLRD